MTRMKRLLAFLLVLIMIFSVGESAVLASEAVGDGTAADDGVVSTDPTPEPTAEPAATPEPTAEPVATPEPTAEPAVTPEPTAEPVATPEPTAEPEQSPEPTLEPEQSPEPSIEPSASPEPTEEPGPKQWPWTEPGNSIAVLMDGGWTLSANGVEYFSEYGVWKDVGGSKTQLSGTPADNLNLVDGWVYFSCGTEIRRVSANGGGEEVVYTAPASVTQMYVMGQEIRFLADGCVYSYDMNDGALEQLETPGTVKKFMPTPYGNLFLTGSFFDYALWAGEYQLMGGIDICYPEGDWLLISKGDDLWQAPMANLFQGQLNLQTYSLHQESAASVLSDEAELASEQAYLESAEYAALEAALTEPAVGSGIMSISSRSAVQTQPLTTNQQNIVLRAKQHSEVLWTPKIWRYTWGGDDPTYNTTGKTTVYDYKGGNKSTDRYLANVTYRGVPYSQPVYTGYVDWGKVTLKTFLDAVNDKNSAFYKSYSTYSRTAPYYGSDCSGFVSYAWDTPIKCTCTSLLKYSTSPITYTGPGCLKVGDAINNPSSHVLLVTDIGYDSNGNVVAVEITEQTPPKMRVTQYIKGDETQYLIAGNRYDRHLNLNNLENTYFNYGYKLYRRNVSSSVKKPTDVAGLNALAAPTMTVKALGPSSVQITLAHEKSGAKIYYSTDSTKGVEFNDNFLYKAPIELKNVNSSVTVRAVAKNGDQESAPLNETLPLAAAPRLDVPSDKTGTIFLYNNVSYVAKSVGAVTLVAESGDTIYYTTNGSDPTTSSSKMESGKGSITVSAGKETVIKAFTVKADGVPSGVQTYTVKAADMYTITVNDPYGVLKPAAGLTVKDGKISVLAGSNVTFEISNSKGYNIGAIKVDGKDIDKSQKSYTFPKVDKDHTIAVILTTPFKDVSESAWYAGAAGFAYANGLISGNDYGNGTVKFDADMNTTRSMFVTILGRYDKASVTYWTSYNKSDTIAADKITTSNRMGVSNGVEINVRPKASLSSTPILTTIEAAGITVNVTGVKDVNGARWYQVKYNGKTGWVRRENPSNNKLLMDVCEFTDLEASDVKYSYGYVQWAYLNGIINGQSATSFGSRGTITREDLCVILYNYLQDVRGVVLNTNATKTFDDAKDISGYAKEAVNALVNIGVINGYEDGKLYPKANANRAVVATIFMNLDKYLNG